jgi:hypothetical protein
MGAELLALHFASPASMEKSGFRASTTTTFVSVLRATNAAISWFVATPAFLAITESVPRMPCPQT